ncbi:HlyD family efflux transporter periplasmic adaptor subunit [Roseateles puraquae]|jgi:adhesin transport system membrane fusion protein|uniref:Secretion protein HlyD n=1 Tax=Roseateles puraquae TaxID=431059 RepID=A0A254NCA6_9BURK|nr:HlyD family efflux transporter periplasmic adaptor subunit [Roseateles puraquae]MDG0852564.1 HlyD family efflux transporter periplasmic adaptor subunit [Roseateles puraquae]OWR05284.1 secretion protein HlyD [Roseateles puraquae]
MTSSLTKEEGAFVSAIHAAHIDEPLPRATWALYLLCGVVTAAITWSALAKVDEITRSDGRIVPDGREQVIASLDAGILRELKVREGQEVQAGQELATLDPTRVEAQQAESQVRLLSLKAAAARLDAEANGRATVRWPTDVDPKSRYVQAEAESFEARKRLLEEAVSSINRSIGMISKELKLAQDMAGRGLMSDVEVMRLNRQVNEIQQQRAERLSRYRQEASQELVRVQSEMAQLDEQMVVRQDALTRTVLKSPVHGVIKSVKAGTIGGVIGSGTPILEISPIGPKVLVEARIKPRDIGFIRLNQTAEVKLAGYDFNTFGGLEGKVTYISPDAVTEGDKTGEGHYRVIVTAERNNLKYKGEPLPVIPGMTSVVEIKTGERSVLSYLLRPMLKSQEALRER